MRKVPKFCNPSTIKNGGPSVMGLLHCTRVHKIQKLTCVHYLLSWIYGKQTQPDSSGQEANVIVRRNICWPCPIQSWTTQRDWGSSFHNSLLCVYISQFTMCVCITIYTSECIYYNVGKTAFSWHFMASMYPQISLHGNLYTVKPGVHSLLHVLWVTVYLFLPCPFIFYQPIFPHSLLFIVSISVSGIVQSFPLNLPISASFSLLTKQQPSSFTLW